MPEEGLDQPGESVRSPADSAGGSARVIRRADGLTKLQAVQRVLYRCAKQDPARRFHALYDKLIRSDVMWQAWCDVAANRGAPGVEGITIESLASEGAEGVEGVRAFLGELAEQIRSGCYRPAPLRRVYIPQPGRPGEQRPLSIPTVADRVVMSAAKLVLEPIFRGRVPAGELWVPPEAICPGSSRGGPGGGQSGPGVGAGRGRLGLFRLA